jgi:site-specific DNA recombinase
MAKWSGKSVKSKSANIEAFTPGDPVVGYFRDSGGAEQERSVDEQRAEWLRECERRGLIPAREFSDRARSGTSAKGRSQFLAMVRYFDSGEAAADGVRGLLLWSFSRFAREEQDAQFFVNLLRRAGFLVQSITDKIPEGKFAGIFESLTFWKDAEYSRDLSEHVQRGQRALLGELYQLVDSGEMVQLVAGGPPPLGYDRVEIVTGQLRDGRPRVNAYWKKTQNEDLARRVRKAWELMIEGKSYAEIEIKCKLGRGANSYKVMFSTLTYTGTYYYGEHQRENAFEAYVTMAEYHEVQKILEKRKGSYHKPTLQRYLLAGMVRCGVCGEPVYGERSTRAGRADLYYYQCASKAKLKASCGLPKIRMERLERLVLGAVLEALDPDTIWALAGRLEGYERTLREKEAGRLAGLRQIIDEETERIKKLTLTLIDLPDGVVGDIRALISLADEKRNKAKSELDSLLVDLPDRGEFQLNLGMLTNAKGLISVWLGAGELSSALIGVEQVKAAHLLLEALDVGITLYPGDENSSLGSAAISLDFGFLSPMSGVSVNSPGVRYRLPTTITIYLS